MIVGFPTEIKPVEYAVGMRRMGVQMIARVGNTPLNQARHCEFRS